MAMDGGIGTYLQQLLPLMANGRPHWRFTVLGDRERLRSLSWHELPNVELQQCNAPIFSAREQLELPLRIRGADVCWIPNYDIPAASRVPLVVTIHDVNHVALASLLGGPVRRLYARWMLRRVVHRATRIVYVSEFTRSEATRLLGDGATRGVVIREGVDDSWSHARASFPERPMREPYLLYVGNIKRHKNVPFLLRAFGRVLDVIPHRLVLIGRTEGLRADGDVAPALAPLGDRAALLGELPPADVRRYLAHAEALVTASLYEGFGLPALESMAAGTPCLVSRAGSFPEICGDAALYGDPHDEEAYARQLARIATDDVLRKSLVVKGRERAASFRWDGAAHATTRVLEEALQF